MKKLGDSHNFGKFVFEKDGKIFKPRTLFWEYLFLSESSPLRAFINNKCDLESLRSPFKVAPNLKIVFENEVIGYAEKLILKDFKATDNLTASNFKEIGALLAMCFWFGLSDLHRDNIKIGFNEEGEFICFPVDIECILDQMTHIHQTLMVPSEKISIDKCGLSLAWTNIFQASFNEKMFLIKSFIDTINLLNTNSFEIFNLLLNIKNTNKNYIRVIIRDTKFYHEVIKHRENSILLPEELVQITRGDIPYFFRTPSNTVLLFISNEGTIKETGFSTDDFKLPSPVKLVHDEDKKLVKLKTALISIAYLAEQLNLEYISKKLGHVSILNNEEVISIHEHAEKIIYTGF